MKSVNSILNSIIAALLIGGIYTLSAVTGETSPIEETGIASETTTETTVPSFSDETVTAASEAVRNIVFITENEAAETTEPPETPDTSDTTELPETTETVETTVTAATTPAAATVAAATAAVTAPANATTTADTELYEEDEPEDTELYEEEDEKNEDDELYEETEPTQDENDFLIGYDEPDGEILDTAPVTTAVTAPQKDIWWNIANGEPVDNSTASGNPSGSATPTLPSTAAATTLTADFNGKRQTVDAFGLVCAVVSNEIKDVFHEEAIKAQAVAAYTYIKEANDRGDAPDVSVDYNYSDKLAKIVSSVWGVACYHNGKLAQTVYSASSAGYTASSANVWGGVKPYLVSVETPFDAASDPNYGIKTTYTESTMRGILESGLKINLSGNPENWIVITSHTDGNYVDTVLIDGQLQISGRDLREDVMNYKIRSAAFSVSYYDGIFTITTYGYGHGVGMSQNGANILAKQGYNYVDILKYYYTGIEVR
ncbi:MAG: SpoIID/LytB domain-containing protein [Ruminococcus sp.]|jgi:stage II sporulation protein D|nr:SpoIID/LytB domain-containing protein [Ruminococcus sp.]